MGLEKTVSLPKVLANHPIVDSGGLSWLGHETVWYDNKAQSRQIDFFQHSEKGFFGVRRPDLLRRIQGTSNRKPGLYSPTWYPTLESAIGAQSNITGEDKEQEFQNNQDRLASALGIKRTRRERTAEETEEAQLIAEEAEALGLVRAETLTTNKETLIKPSRGLVWDLAERDGNVCDNCGHSYGIWVAKGNGLPVSLIPTFDHDTPDTAFSTITEKNQNTLNSKNKAICFICNNAKSSYVKREAILTPVSLEDQRKLSVVAWKRWAVLTAEEAYQRELNYVNEKYKMREVA